MISIIKDKLRIIRSLLIKFTNPFNFFKMKREIDVLYSMLYDFVQDLDSSLDIAGKQTEDAFGTQWSQYNKGRLLVDSDPWFKKNCIRILTEQEILIKPEWFSGKKVLDAGCGNGRWAYPLAKLGVNYTGVDVNKSAIDRTQELIKDINIEKEFIQSSLENLLENLSVKNKYDLVISWGVVHHVKEFNKSLDNLTKLVNDDGILYLYLYGRESLSYEDDVEYFKNRMYYNSLSKEYEKYQFLLKKTRGPYFWRKAKESEINNIHDEYAPLINRRLDFDYIRKFLEDRGFEDIVRTVDHSELFVRAIKSNSKKYYNEYILPSNQDDPYWINRPGTLEE